MRRQTLLNVCTFSGVTLDKSLQFTPNGLRACCCLLPWPMPYAHVARTDLFQDTADDTRRDRCDRLPAQVFASIVVFANNIASSLTKLGIQIGRSDLNISEQPPTTPEFPRGPVRNSLASSCRLRIAHYGAGISRRALCFRPFQC